MSQAVDVTKEVTMEVSVYSMTCKCGSDIDFKIEVDSDGDLVIEINEHPCIQGEE